MTGFELIAATINEPAFTSDELRIIAKDARSLNKQDRQSIVRGAEEPELANRSLAMIYGELMLARQELAAVRERLPKVPPAVVFDSLSLKIGPVPMRVSTGWDRLK